MRLYHFTCLLHLPPILREGITMGEVPIPVSTDRFPSAPNLTTNPSPDAQLWMCNGKFNKLRVRLTVDVPDGDGKLQSWTDTSKQHNIPRSWSRRLDPTGQRKFWYIYWGVVPTAWITSVEVRDRLGYVPVAGDVLAGLVDRIDEESRHFIRNGDFTSVAEGHEDSWLLDDGSADLPFDLRPGR
jgi:hypothetical protein